MMSNFTPGKWGVHPAGGIYADQEPAPGEHNKRRVEVWLDEYTEEHKTNARLVAAAPEMVDLLDDALLELSLVSGILEPNNGHVEALIERINKLFQRLKGEEEAQ